MRLSAWEKLVRRCFDCVEVHGFARTKQLDRSDFWATSVVYASARHAVRVTYTDTVWPDGVHGAMTFVAQLALADLDPSVWTGPTPPGRMVPPKRPSNTTELGG